MSFKAENEDVEKLIEIELETLKFRIKIYEEVLANCSEIKNRINQKLLEEKWK